MPATNELEARVRAHLAEIERAGLRHYDLAVPAPAPPPDAGELSGGAHPRIRDDRHVHNLRAVEFRDARMSVLAAAEYVCSAR